MHIWTKDKVDMLLKLHEQEGLTHKQKAVRMTELFNENFTFQSIKKKIQRLNRDSPVKLPEYRETIEILSDGSHKSDKLVRMSAEQSKDVNFLLDAHGYDKDEWELVSARNNFWEVYSKQDGVQTLYSSKITVKPKETGFDFNKLIEAVEKRKPAKPIIFTGKTVKEPTYLNIPFFDLHFGPSTLEHYHETLRDTVELLERSYNEVLIVIGQDMLHNDDMRGRTSSGREIEKVNMVKAWDDADIFFTTILEKALEKSPKVSVLYSKGNHDESMYVMGLC